MTIAEFLSARLDADQRYLNSNRHHLWTERPLREVAAKRAILSRHEPRQLDRWQVCGNCRPVDPECPGDLTSVPWPCPDLRDLAAVYSDHADYDAAWKSEGSRS